MRTSTRRWGIVAGAVAICGLATTAITAPATAATTSDQQGWVTAISSDVNHRNAQALQTTSAQFRALTKAPLVSAGRAQAISAEDQKLRQQADWFAKHGDTFTSFRTTIDVLKSAITGDSASVDFKETTWMTRAPLPDGTPLPDYAYDATQHADLTNVGGTWKVATLTHADKETATTMYSPKLLTAMTSGTMEPGYQKWQQQKKQAATAKSGSLMQPQVLYANKPAILAYAAQYWSNYNSAYLAQYNDCTNFVSQALYAGGWKQTAATGDKNDPTAWFYNGFSLPAFWSKTWVNAPAQNAYGTNKGQMSLEPGAGFLSGDIAYFIWDTSKTTSFDHAGIVTKVVGYEPYFAYHTSNRYNISWTQVKANAVASGETQYDFNVGLFDFHV